LLNASKSGSLGGRPEWACCACGRGSAVSVRARRLRHEVRQLFFYTTHSMDHIDSRILAHYRRDAATLPHVRLWVLYSLFNGENVSSSNSTDDDVEREQRSWQGVHGVDTMLWSLRDVRRTFPKLARTVSRQRLTSNKFGLYWFVHASLLVWNKTLGHEFPAVQYWWRIEPDVLVASSRPLTTMVQQTLAANLDWDILTPALLVFATALERADACCSRTHRRRPRCAAPLLRSRAMTRGHTSTGSSTWITCATSRSKCRCTLSSASIATPPLSCVT
jgi:hypothetical protein